MPWVRFDDQFPIHRKVMGLSDSAFRLHAEAIFWCARNLTDGFVAASDLPELATARRPLKLLPVLVTRGNWHEAAAVCRSEKCPAHPDHRPEQAGQGWVIHDYFEYQPSKVQVEAERRAKAERQRRWLSKKHQGRDASKDASIDASIDAAPYPSRPDPKGRGSVGESSSGPRRARDHDDDDDDSRIDRQIVALLGELTGKTIDLGWAGKVRAAILTGRDPDNPSAYIAACIRGNPRNFLPAADEHPSSRGVAEALGRGRGVKNPDAAERGVAAARKGLRKRP